MESIARNPGSSLSKAELKHFFLSHLNRIYCAKSQLVEKLPLLEDKAAFLDLQQAIEETIDVVRLDIPLILTT